MTLRNSVPDVEPANGRRAAAIPAGLLAALAAVGCVCGTVSAQDALAQLPAYVKSPVGVTSNILLVAGTRELDGLVRQWGAQFLRSFGHARLELQTSDSVQAIVRLKDTPGCIGLVSRPLRPDEERDLAQALGQPPAVVRVAADRVVACVHKDNPIAQSGLSLAQLDALFSRTRRAGHAAELRTWGQLGLPAPWSDQPVRLHAGAKASPVSEFFARSVLLGGAFRDEVEHGVRDGEPAGIVATNRYAIGITTARACGNEVALVPVTATSDTPPVAPAAAACESYPLTRYIFAVLSLPRERPLDGARREFLRIVFSREGQAAAAKAGYAPLSASFARAELEKVGVPLVLTPHRGSR